MIDKSRKAWYNMNIESTEMLYGLYGSHISREKAVGYCKKHCAALTVRTLKGHECLKKQCNALKKYDHSYWTQREVLKARKKENRLNGGIC